MTALSQPRGASGLGCNAYTDNSAPSLFFLGLFFCDKTI
jgi:hypothetical protein